VSAGWPLGLYEEFTVFLLVLARVSAIFAATPVLGGRDVPVQLKAGLALILALVLLPVVAAPPQGVPAHLWAYGLWVLGEVGVGLLLGFAALLLFVAAQVAGQIIDFELGFGIVNVIDPEFGHQLPLVGSFKNLLALLVFLGLNGHHVVIRALAGSFRVLPPGQARWAPELTGNVVGLLGQLFVFALQLAAPVMAAIFLVNLALGIVSRTVPQMNVFVVGLPVQAAVGLAVLALVLPFTVALLAGLLEGLGRQLEAVIGILAR